MVLKVLILQPYQLVHHLRILLDSLNYIRLGYSDIIVSGGSEAGVTIAGIGGFNAVQALSKRNDDPKCI